MPKTPITYYGGKINLVATILPLLPEENTGVKQKYKLLSREATKHNDYDHLVKIIHEHCKY